MNPTTSKPDSPKETSAMSTLELKLKSADSEIQFFVTALKKENLKLHKQIAKLQAENVSLNSRITVREEEAKIPKADISISIGDSHA